MSAGRRPEEVPEEGGIEHHADITAGIDTDGDGRPDTLLTDDGFDLVLLTDLDGDGLADRMLRIGPDGLVHDAGWEPG